jgi:hypothetical protein
MKDWVIIIPAGICLYTGTYLILKPQRYKDELKEYEDVISRFPRWAIRILGAFLIAFAVGVSYLLLTASK